MTIETKTALSEAQRARVEAIRVAREVLQDSKNGAVFVGSSGTLPEHRSAVDLVDVAEYVEAGSHPLERYRGSADVDEVLDEGDEGDVS